MPIKFYAVACGRKTGVFETWQECNRQVHRYHGAKFKSFPTRQAAQAYVNTAASEILTNRTHSSPLSINSTSMTASAMSTQNSHEVSPKSEHEGDSNENVFHASTHPCWGIQGGQRQVSKLLKMGKFYAVAHGRRTGIFQNWEECQKQVHGYKDAKFKSFRTPQEAREYIQNYRKQTLNSRSSAIPSLSNKDQFVGPNSKPSDTKSAASSPKQLCGMTAGLKQAAASTLSEAKVAQRPYQEKAACARTNILHSSPQRIGVASETRNIPNLNPAQQANVSGATMLPALLNPTATSKPTTKNLAHLDEVATVQSPQKRARVESEANEARTPPKKYHASIGKSGTMYKCATLNPKSQGSSSFQSAGGSNDPSAAQWLTAEIFDRLEQEAVRASQTTSQSHSKNNNLEQPSTSVGEEKCISLSFSGTLSCTTLDSTGVSITVPSKEGLGKECRPQSYQRYQLEENEVIDFEDRDDSQNICEEEDPLNVSLTQHVLEVSRNVGIINDERTARIKAHMNAMRQFLEKFLKDQGIQERNLRRSIEKFGACNSPKPSREFIESMHGIREYGNIGSHDSDGSLIAIEEKFKDVVEQFKRLEREYSRSIRYLNCPSTTSKH